MYIESTSAKPSCYRIESRTISFFCIRSSSSFQAKEVNSSKRNLIPHKKRFTFIEYSTRINAHACKHTHIHRQRALLTNKMHITDRQDTKITLVSMPLDCVLTFYVNIFGHFGFHPFLYPLRL